MFPRLYWFTSNFSFPVLMSFLLHYVSLWYFRVTSLVSFSVPHWSLSSSFLCFSVWFPSLSISVCHYWALLLFAYSIKFVFWVWVSVYVFIVLPVFLYSCLVVSNWFQLCPPTLLITCMCIYCVSLPLSNWHRFTFLHVFLGSLMFFESLTQHLSCNYYKHDERKLKGNLKLSFF